MVETTEIYILIAVWVTLSFMQGYSWMRNQKLVVLIFSQMLQPILIKFSMLPQPFGLLKLMLTLFCKIYFQGRELYKADFRKCTFNIGLCPDTYKLICSKLGSTLNTSQL